MSSKKTPDTFTCESWKHLYLYHITFFYPAFVSEDPGQRMLWSMGSRRCKPRRMAQRNGLLSSLETELQKLSSEHHQNRDVFLFRRKWRTRVV